MQKTKVQSSSGSSPSLSGHALNDESLTAKTAVSTSVKSSMEDEIPPGFLRSAFNQVVYDSLLPVSLGVCLFHMFLVLVYSLFLPPPIEAIMVPMAIGAAVLLFLLYLALRRWQIDARWAHPISALIANLALVTNLTHLYISQEPRQTLIVTGIVIGVGFFFLSLRWLAFVLAEILIAWLVVAMRLPLSPALAYYAFLLIMSVGLAGVTFVIRRRSYERYERLRLQDERRKQELQHRARQLEISMSLGKHITSILDLDTLLHEVVDLICSRYGYSYVGIYLLDETGEYVHARAGTGEVGRALRRQDFKLKVGQEGLVGSVAANGRSICVDDVTQDKRYYAASPELQTRSELDLPLRMRQSMLGVLTLQSDQLAAFHADDIPFLQSLADQVAIAIYNASLYQGEQSARRLAETMHETGRALTGTLEWESVLNLILERLAEIVPYDRASILVNRSGRLEVVAEHGFPPESEPLQIRIALEDERIFEEIYRTQRPLSIPDVMQRSDWQQVPLLPLARAWLGVPLIHADEVVGMLSLTRETLNTYEDEEMTLATAFAAPAAIALENARLYHKSTEFTQQLEYEVQQRTQAVQEAYQQLEQLDRTKIDFITIASHELRTPLTILKGYVQMLMRHEDVRNSDVQSGYVEGIQAGASRLEEIINSMLDVAKIDNRALLLYPEPVSLPELIHETCDQFGTALEKRNLTLTVEAMPDLPPIGADPEALKKVFYHLIVNAIKYTPDGGSITISGEPLKRTGLDLPQEGVEIVVSDTGIGIDPEFHDLVFAKFYQTGEVALHSSAKTTYKGGGPGLGLAIVRGIVEAHRGRIWVESPGHDEKSNPGSRFIIVLPLRQKR